MPSPSLGTSSTHSSSARVAVNTTKATFLPGALELTTVMVQDFMCPPTTAAAATTTTTTTTTTSITSAYEQQEQVRREQAQDGISDVVLPDLFCGAMETTTLPYQQKAITNTPTKNGTAKANANATAASSPAENSPITPRVSPRSILENIDKRARRRREILQNSLPPTSSSSFDKDNNHQHHHHQQHGLTPVPAMIHAKPKKKSIHNSINNINNNINNNNTRLRPPSPPSMTSSSSQSTASQSPVYQRPMVTIGTHTNTTRGAAAANVPSFSLQTAQKYHQQHHHQQHPPHPHAQNNNNNNNNNNTSNDPQTATTLAFWQDRLHQILQRSGGKASTSMAVGRAYMNVGHAHVANRHYEAAVTQYAVAARIFRSTSQQVAYAAALHHQGTATSRSTTIADKAFQIQALTLLTQAWQLRRQFLGDNHVDTVATENSMAWVQYYMAKYKAASQAFWYVFWKRQAIFGPRHPAVAVAATDLARTFGTLGRQDDATNFYSIALQIYHQMNVPDSNPAVQRLLRDLQALRAGQFPVASSSLSRKHSGSPSRHKRRTTASSL